MKTILLTAFLALSLMPAVSFAFETSNVDCDAYAETTERSGKDLKDSKKQNKDSSKAKSE